MALTLDGTVGLKQSLPFMISQVCFFAGNTAPTGFLACSGQLISRTTYASLFAIIGTTYGAGDGSTTFALPDLRGEFIRGWDNGRGVDTGRGFASAQGFAMQNITGRIRAAAFANTTPSALAEGAFAIESNGNAGYASGGGIASTLPVYNIDASRVATTATETRPRNVALLACIFTGV